ncbi:MAG: septal ring lytic transglycosylase RlpA family protein [Chitinivibrionales bacterium]|nr:septal ring lytic transglycosylase RlpA family protein [Chitinivibrionales bacterium]
MGKKKKLSALPGACGIFLLLLSCATVPRYNRKPTCGTAQNQPLPNNPKKSPSANTKGTASYYGKKFHGKKTANGERFDMHALTAAHKTLPFNTRVKVTNFNNNRSVIVRINDRGPFKKGRIIDLSRGAAKKIGLIQTGAAPVRLEILP